MSTISNLNAIPTGTDTKNLVDTAAANQSFRIFSKALRQSSTCLPGSGR